MFLHQKRMWSSSTPPCLSLNAHVYYIHNCFAATSASLNMYKIYFADSFGLLFPPVACSRFEINFIADEWPLSEGEIALLLCALATVISLSGCHNNGSVHIKVTKPTLLLACSYIWCLLSAPHFYCRFHEGWLVRKGTFFHLVCKQAEEDESLPNQSHTAFE